MSTAAIVLANGMYRSPHGKVAHGLVRGGERYRVVAVVDPGCAGADAGELLDGRRRGIPLVASIPEALASAAEPPEVCVVGIATHGGRFTTELRGLLLEAVRAGLSLVNGLHDAAADDPEIAAEAARRGLSLTDLRRPRPLSELHFWSGGVTRVAAPRVAVLGTDCAVGKRTTARLLVASLARAGLRAEMIYTGQTGWMQGGRFGFVLDAVANDFVSGEVEHAILTCEREASPDVMVIEGQSSLRNPSGPCGGELLLSAGARGAVLQHAPGRACFDGFAALDLRIPPVEEEVALVALYGTRVLAVALNGEGLTPGQLAAEQAQLRERLDLPVVRPLEEGVEELAQAVREFVEEEGR